MLKFVIFLLLFRIYGIKCDDEMPFVQTGTGILIKSVGNFNISGAMNGIIITACTPKPTIDLVQYCVSPGYPGYGYDSPCGVCSIRLAAANGSASIYVGTEELHVNDKYCISINMMAQMEIEDKNVPEGIKCMIDLQHGAQINVISLPKSWVLNLK
uniref:Uncharacterized protein n=1 Tax=Panagrolaimus sp. JU765 TaxID=591449 RepID=A0AC34PX78_9BILA